MAEGATPAPEGAADAFHDVVDVVAVVVAFSIVAVAAVEVELVRCI